MSLELGIHVGGGQLNSKIELNKQRQQKMDEIKIMVDEHGIDNIFFGYRREDDSETDGGYILSKINSDSMTITLKKKASNINAEYSIEVDPLDITYIMPIN